MLSIHIYKHHSHLHYVHKYLECNETRDCEGYNAPNNSFDIVSGAKEYSDHKGTTLIGTIQREDEKDEDSLLEVA